MSTSADHVSPHVALEFNAHCLYTVRTVLAKSFVFFLSLSLLHAFSFFFRFKIWMMEARIASELKTESIKKRFFQWTLGLVPKLVDGNFLERYWINIIDPGLMCAITLLGEHSETFRRFVSIKEKQGLPVLWKEKHLVLEVVTQTESQAFNQPNVCTSQDSWDLAWICQIIALSFYQNQQIKHRKSLPVETSSRNYFSQKAQFVPVLSNFKLSFFQGNLIVCVWCRNMADWKYFLFPVFHLQQRWWDLSLKGRILGDFCEGRNFLTWYFHSITWFLEVSSGKNAAFQIKSKNFQNLLAYSWIVEIEKRGFFADPWVLCFPKYRCLAIERECSCFHCPWRWRTVCVHCGVCGCEQVWMCSKRWKTFSHVNKDHVEMENKWKTKRQCNLIHWKWSSLSWKFLLSCKTSAVQRRGPRDWSVSESVKWVFRGLLSNFATTQLILNCIWLKSGVLKKYQNVLEGHKISRRWALSLRWQWTQAHTNSSLFCTLHGWLTVCPPHHTPQ